MRQLLIALLPSLVLVTTLAACGGGGGGGGTDPVVEVDPPVITSQPADADVIEGQTATFDVAATGDGTLGYQWQRRVGGGSWTDLAGASGTSYTTPAAALADDGNEYRCVVSNDGGSTASAAAQLGVSATPPYSHTIVIDGANDFLGDEGFQGTDDGIGFITWDASYLYVGVDTPLFTLARAEDWFVIYLGGSPGTTTGLAIGVQEPALPFAAHTCVRVRGDGGAIEAWQWGGTSWNDAGWDFTGDWLAEETYLELRIPRIDIGISSTVQVHLSYVSDVDMEETTTLGVPDTSFTSGLDPDYAAYFEFDYLGTVAPNTYTPLP